MSEMRTKQVILDANTEEQVCTNCGYVIKEGIEDTGPEWRNFAKEQGEDDRSRTGSPSSLALHDMGLSTVIGLEGTDASGNALKASMKNQLERLLSGIRRNKVHDSADRNFRQVSVTYRLAEKINVGAQVIEKAAYIYRKQWRKN